MTPQVCGLVDGWLGADRQAPRKQRHTAKRIHQRLVREHCFVGGASTVGRRRRELSVGKEVFVPQGHEPGRTAEVWKSGPTVAVGSGSSVPGRMAPKASTCPRSSSSNGWPLWFRRLAPTPCVPGLEDHGVLAARSALRKRVQPRGRRRPQRGRAAADRLAKKPSAASRWVPWAWLLWRAFEVDSWACPNCDHRLRLRTVPLHGGCGPGDAGGAGVAEALGARAASAGPQGGRGLNRRSVAGREGCVRGVRETRWGLSKRSSVSLEAP